VHLEFGLDLRSDHAPTPQQHLVLRGHQPHHLRGQRHTTGSWASDPGFPDIAAGDFYALTVEPDTVNEEITYLFGPFVAGTLSSTHFLRAAEATAAGQVAFAHAATPWTHGPTAQDIGQRYLIAGLVSAFPTEMSLSPPSGPATVDGGTVTDGQRVLLTAQTNLLDNGLWAGNTTGPWVRPPEWPTGAVIPDGVLVSIEEGPGGRLYQSLWATSGPTTVDTTDSFWSLMASNTGLQFTPAVGANPSVTTGGSLTANGDLIAAGGGKVVVNGAGIYAFAGDPNTHVTPNVKGAVLLDTTTPAFWQAGAAGVNTSWVQLGSGGGSGGIGALADFAFSDADTSILADGTAHGGLALIMATPPSWMDTSGNITEPGLYALGLAVFLEVSFTTPGLYAEVQGNGPIGANPIAMDGLVAGENLVSYVVALGAGDVPFNTAFQVPMPTDATGEIQIQTQCFQLATGAGGGGGGAGNTVVRKFPFTFSETDLAFGAPLYTPTVGDILLDAWIEVDTAWDGTTPLGDIGIIFTGAFPFTPFDGIAQGFFYAMSGSGADAVPMTHADSAGGIGVLGTVFSMTAVGRSIFNGHRYFPAKFTVADPVGVIVTVDGRSPGSAFCIAATSLSAIGDNLTVVTGVNDEFVFTPIFTGVPETFTIAPGNYPSAAAIEAAMGAALGLAAEAFSTHCTVNDASGTILLDKVAPGVGSNGDTLSAGANDVAAALGFTSTGTFSGGTGGDPGSSVGSGVLYLVTATPA
jgi:hypothetical protein